MAASVSELCQQKKLTAEQLAQLANVDELHVVAILNGRWTPSPQERIKIAAALSVAVEDIAWGHITPVQHIYGQGPS